MKETSSDSNSKNVKKLGEMIEDIEVAMLTTIGPDGVLHSCPMMTQEGEFDGELWFFTKRNTLKTANIEHEPKVNVVYSEPEDQVYVSITGRAEVVVDDRAKVDELWTPAHKLWFDGGKEDPQLCLIRVDVESAEYWDSPTSPAVTLAGFAKSLITGKSPSKVGEHDKLEIH